MHFEPWMFAAMEDEGIMDTRPYYFDQEDIEKIGQKIRSLR